MLTALAASQVVEKNATPSSVASLIMSMSLQDFELDPRRGLYADDSIIYSCDRNLDNITHKLENDCNVACSNFQQCDLRCIYYAA